MLKFDRVWFCIENVSLELRKESARLLNATAIESGYAERDPQEGTAIEALSKFF